MTKAKQNDEPQVEQQAAQDPSQIVDTSASINEPPGSNTAPVEEDYVEPVPAITSMEPMECMIGDPDFTLVIGGDNIHGSTMINFAGHDEPTTFDDVAATVSTGVKPSLWAEPAVVPVKLRNGGIESVAMEFTFSAPVTRGAKEEDEDDDDKLPHHKRSSNKRR